MSAAAAQGLRIGSASAILGALALVLAVGCAHKQRVPLDCVPEQVTVYVDGRALEETPEALELAANRPHTVMFRRPGYRPQMVVLRSGTGDDGGPALAPAQLCVELVPVAMNRDLVLEVEEEE